MSIDQIADFVAALSFAKQTLEYHGAMLYVLLVGSECYLWLLATLTWCLVFALFVWFIVSLQSTCREHITLNYSIEARIGGSGFVSQPL